MTQAHVDGQRKRRQRQALFEDDFHLTFENVQIRVSTRERDAIKAAAERCGLSISEFVRRCVFPHVILPTADDVSDAIDRWAGETVDG